MAINKFTQQIRKKGFINIQMVWCCLWEEFYDWLIIIKIFLADTLFVQPCGIWNLLAKIHCLRGKSYTVKSQLLKNGFLYFHIKYLFGMKDQGK